MTKFLIAAATAAMAVAISTAPVSAQTPQPPGVAQGTAPMPAAPPPLPGTRRAPQARMMVMSDRTMTRAEVSQHVAKLFTRMDSNHDGFVTREEVDALHPRMMMGMEGMKHGMDGMKRGMNAMSVAPGMAPPDRAAMFERLDTNHDGAISRQEYMAAKPQIREQRTIVLRDGKTPDTAPSATGEHQMMMMRMHGMGGHMGMGRAGLSGRLFEMADANHDGRVSLAEAQTAALAHFDRADGNHDGKITPDERQQIRQTIRIERRAS
jgi:hypothetical protein